ncbi:O-antigen ligase family protein [Phenylobacterium sp. LjRoot219]|uniref:O-antigen ligase family protein n=1 Tax=Phenylobacterium sp. LjRoot219 TaxID=3342283 RepID=UPI003ECEB34E
MSAAAAAASMSPARDRLGAWCGWVMVGAAGLIPLLGWLSPLGFAPLLALMGLLCLPAIRMSDEDRPVLIVLLGALVWAAASTTWSLQQPKPGGHGVIVEIALALPLFWSAICGARRANPRLNRLALQVLAWGLGLFGLILLVDTFADARIYRWLHERYYEPIRPDLARSNVAHTTFVLAVLWPVVMVGGLRRLIDLVPLALAIAGTVAAAYAFGSDAPVLAFPLAAIAILGVWLTPRTGPRLLALGVAAVSFLMPAFVWLVRASSDYGRLEQGVQLSWSARMSYWSHTVDWILQHPLKGWGLDASRAMGPGITLHPHNGALQVWLELGFVGAVAAAAFWGLSLVRLSREKPDLAMSGAAGSAVVYLLFAWINYGLWQQWWLALGALIAVVAAMLDNRDDTPKST